MNAAKMILVIGLVSTGFMACKPNKSKGQLSADSADTKQFNGLSICFAGEGNKPNLTVKVSKETIAWDMAVGNFVTTNYKYALNRSNGEINYTVLNTGVESEKKLFKPSDAEHTKALQDILKNLKAIAKGDSCNEAQPAADETAKEIEALLAKSQASKEAAVKQFSGLSICFVGEGNKPNLTVNVSKEAIAWETSVGNFVTTTNTYTMDRSSGQINYVSVSGGAQIEKKLLKPSEAEHKAAAENILKNLEAIVKGDSCNKAQPEAQEAVDAIKAILAKA